MHQELSLLMVGLVTILAEATYISRELTLTI